MSDYREPDPTDALKASESHVVEGGIQALDQLRVLPDRPRPSVERVSRELAHRTDPARVLPETGIELPWSDAARVRRRARDASFEARLEIFQDDLRAIRIANEVLNRAATMRAVEAAEIAIFEIRSLGETTRLGIVNRAQIEMTRHFMLQLESIEGFRGRLTDEILDALKERALTEFTERVNRASRADLDLEFAKAEILRLTP